MHSLTAKPSGCMAARWLLQAAGPTSLAHPNVLHRSLCTRLLSASGSSRFRSTKLHKEDGPLGRLWRSHAIASTHTITSPAWNSMTCHDAAVRRCAEQVGRLHVRPPAALTPISLPQWALAAGAATAARCPETGRHPHREQRILQGRTCCQSTIPGRGTQGEAHTRSGQCLLPQSHKP